MIRKSILPILLLSASLGAGAALPLAAQPAQAQGAPPAPGQQAPRPPQPMPPSRVEGRIAYLKAELKITPAQEAAFDKVAQAMRQNDTERRQAFEEARARRDQANPTRPNALQRLEREARFSAMRTQETDRFLAAFRPLYDSLSPDQKQVADSLGGFHGRPGRFGHRRG